MLSWSSEVKDVISSDVRITFILGAYLGIIQLLS